MAERGKVRPNCIYVSNPYHECNDYCLRKTAEAKMQKADKKNSGSFVLDISGSFSKKRKESRPKRLHELDAVPISSTVSSVAQSPTTRVSPRRKSEPRNGNMIPHSQPHSKEARVKDPSPDNNIFVSSQLVPASEHISKSNYPKEIAEDSVTTIATVTPKKNKKREDKLQELSDIYKFPIVNAPNSAANSPARSGFSFSGISHTLEDDDEEEIESVTSEYIVSVGMYRVKASFSSILESIFEKFGDIAATCKLESIAMRSYYLECVCYVVQELQNSTQTKQLTKSKAKELLSILKDVESSGIDVEWLRRLLDEVTEAIEFNSKHRAIETEKANCDRDLELIKKELEFQMEDLELKEKEAADAKARVEETRARLSELELKSSQLNEVILSVRSKVDDIDYESYLINSNKTKEAV